MFRKAVREAMKRQRGNYQWLSDETDIPKPSIQSFLGNSGRSLSTGRIEKIFKVLGIKIVVPE